MVDTVHVLLLQPRKNLDELYRYNFMTIFLLVILTVFIKIGVFEMHWFAVLLLEKRRREVKVFSFCSLATSSRGNWQAGMICASHSCADGRVHAACKVATMMLKTPGKRRIYGLEAFEKSWLFWLWVCALNSITWSFSTLCMSTQPWLSSCVIGCSEVIS